MFLSMPFIKRAAGAALLALAVSPAVHASAGQEAANKAAVLAFYEKGLNQKDADAALKYVGDRYVQHNPNAADGPEGFRKFIAFLRDKFPKSHSEIKRVFTDGDYQPLEVSGRDADHVIAFARRHRGDAAVVIVGRRFAQFTDGGRHWPQSGAFDAEVALPGYTLIDPIGNGALRVSAVFADFPAAVLPARVSGRRR